MIPLFKPLTKFFIPTRYRVWKICIAQIVSISIDIRIMVDFRGVMCEIRSSLQRFYPWWGTRQISPRFSLLFHFSLWIEELYYVFINFCFEYYVPREYVVWLSRIVVIGFAWWRRCILFNIIVKVGSVSTIILLQSLYRTGFWFYIVNLDLLEIEIEVI